MAFFNIFGWFGFSSKTSKENEKPTVYTLSQDEYETIMQRLRNLEAMINSMPIRPAIPEPPPLPKEDKKKQPKKVVRQLNTFQQELMTKLEHLRNRMGESHGFGIGDAEDMEYLEKSLMCIT